MILWPILIGVYLICTVGSYKIGMRTATLPVSPVLLGILSFFWPVSLFYTFFKEAIR